MNASASATFSKALDCIARRGWFSSWPSEVDGGSLLYAAFHVHPEDADAVSSMLESSSLTYGGQTRWVILRPKQNRFVVFPEELNEFNTTDNLGKAAVLLRQAYPNLERQAGADIRRFSEHLYAAFPQSPRGAA